MDELKGELLRAGPGELARALGRGARDRDTLLRALMDMPALIAILRGPQLVYEYANRASLRFAGVESVVGKPFGTTGFVDRAGTDHRAIVRRVFETGEPYAGRVHVIIDHGGERIQDRYFDLSYVPLRDEAGAIDAVLIFSVDVSGLAKSEARMRRIVESNMVGMLFWNKKGLITDANDALLKMVGYTRQDLIDGRVNWLQMTPPEFMDVEKRAHEELAARRVCTPFEKEYVHKDGHRVPILIGGALFEDDDTGGVAFVLDMTERRQIEEGRQRIQAQLLQAQKVESLGVLAGGIAHDFNNLLTGILANASLALLRLEPDSQAREAIQDAVVCAQKARDLVRQLLAYAGKGAARVQAIDLSEHVREIARLLEATIASKVDLELSLAPSLPAIEADPAQIQQIVMNLIINAAEAIVGARGRVRVSTGERALGEGEEVGAGRYVFLEVVDDGCGMDEPTRARMFDPLFSTKRGGHGLGLSAVVGIVRAHRGAIRVTSGVGAGTTITVLFPASARAVRPESRPSMRAVRGSGVVLLVDDEVHVRSVTRKILEHLGFEVLEAKDGRHAVEVFRENAARVRLVLLDMSMPELSGDQALAEMRRVRDDVPVIVSSGYAKSDALKGAPLHRVAGFLEKPYTAEALATAVASALGIVRDAI